MESPQWLKETLKPRRIQQPFSGGKILFGLSSCVLFFFIWPLAFRYAQEPARHFSGRVIFVLGPILILLYFYAFVGAARRFGKVREPYDEREQRIMLEGSQFSYRVSFAVLMSAALFPAVFPSLSTNPYFRNVWIILPISQNIGLWIAQWRYR